MLAIGTIFVACSEKTSDPIRRGPHPTTFVNKTSEQFHGLRVRDADMGGNASCLACHTVVAVDSTAEAIALSCANSSGCHARSETATSLSCGTCHARSELPPSHQEHFAAGVSACALCHAATFSATGALLDSVHMNAVLDVAMSTAVQGTFNADAMTCSDSRCHGITQPNTSPAWGAAGNLTCQSCHAFADLSGMHDTHFTQSAANCGMCHASTAVNATTLQPDTKTHANLTPDVVFATTYGGSFDAAAGTCSDTYCHGVAVTTPAWTGTTTLNCQSCHAFTELPGAHGKHLAKNDDCSVCHATTALSNSAISNPAFHGNREIEVVLSAAVKGEFVPMTQTCANTACHGAASPPWTATADLDCNSCHAKIDLPGAHQAHFTRSPANCETCHAETATDSSAIKNPQLHLNFTVDVALIDGIDGTYDAATETCSNTYCHLDATPTPSWNGSTDLRCQSCHPYATLPDNHGVHIDTFGNICGTCHASTVRGAYSLIDHNKHANQIYDVALVDSVGGTYSTDTRTCANNWCHGPRNDVVSPAWTGTTDLDCQGCHPTASLSVGHAFHVTTMGKQCQNCHNATAISPTELTTDAPHVDGTVQVVGTYTNLSYDTGANTCSSSQNPCHNPGPSKNWFTLE